MPRTTSSPDEKRALLASRAEAQMASTNTTANAFLGTRQPSWLTANAKQRTAPTAGPPLTTDMARAVPAVAPAPGAPAAAPAAPPQAPAETRAPPLPTLNPADPKPVSTSTNLSQSDCSLLSPAPTDEASPAAASPDAIVPPAETTAEEVTHIHDFPSLRRALSEERQRRRAEKQMSTAPDTNAADDTPSEPRQPRISTNGAAPCQAQSDANSQEAAQHSRRQSLDVVAGAPPVDDRPQRVLPPNAPLATTMASSVSTGQVNLVPEEPSNTDPLPPTVPPEPATATEIAAAIAAATAKAAGGTNSGSTQATLEEQQNVYFPRTLVRTTTGNAEFSYVALAQLVSNQITQLKREGSPFTLSEAQRLSNLNCALRIEDVFFVAANQLLCLWLVDTAESHFQLAPLPSHLIDHSFGILQQILETNGQIRPTLLAWFSQFPGNIDDMIRHTSNYTQVIVQVRAFLERLALYWGPLSNSVAMRGYPLLVDELLSRLLCLSPTLQNLLSTASRKYLQPARDLGDTAFDEIFMKDLTQHQPALSTFIALPEPRFAEDLEWVNAGTIACYREALRSSPAEGARRPSVPHSAAPNTKLAQQPPRQVAQIQQIRVPQTQEFQSIQQPQYAQQTFQRPLQQRVVDQNTSQAAAISPVLAESCLPVGAAYMAHVRRANASVSLDGNAAQPMLADRGRTASLQHPQQQLQQQQQPHLNIQPQRFIRPHPQQTPQPMSPVQTPQQPMPYRQGQTMRATGKTPMLPTLRLAQQGPTSPQLLQGQSPQMAQSPHVSSRVQAQVRSNVQAQAQQLQHMQQMHVAQQTQEPQQTQYTQQLQHAQQRQQGQQGQHAQYAQQGQQLQWRQLQAPPRQVPSQQYALQQGPTQQGQPVQSLSTAERRRMLEQFQLQQRLQLDELHRQQQLQLEREQHAQQAPHMETPTDSQQIRQRQQVMQTRQRTILPAQPMQPGQQQLRQVQQTQQAQPAQPAQQISTMHQMQQMQQMQQVQQMQQMQQVQQLQRHQREQPVSPAALLSPTQPQIQHWPQTTQGSVGLAGQPGQVPRNYTTMQQSRLPTTLRSPVPSPVQSPGLAQQAARFPPVQPPANAMYYAENTASVSRNSLIQTNIPPITLQPAGAVPSAPALGQQIASDIPAQAQPHQPQQQQQEEQQQQTQQPQQQPSLVGGRQQHQDAPISLEGHRSIFPPAGSTIARSEYPLDPNDFRAFQQALTQLDRRSPTRVMINRTSQKLLPPKPGSPRFYQYVQRLTLGPCSTPIRKIMYTFEFTITEEDFAQICFRSTPQGALLPIESHFDGSLSYRVRCCTARDGVQAMTESEWVTSNTQWPVNIFMKINGTAVFARRQSHNGKDLPVNITQLILFGVNKVEVAIPEQSSKSSTSPNYFFGVETVETAHCNRSVDYIMKNGVQHASVTVDKIKSRLRSTSDDDGFTILQNSVSVDLADPYSARLFKIPVRGAQCQHIECFDLHNWLNTRPVCTSYPMNPFCQHAYDCTCPKPQEPTMPDKWRCPICSNDARPTSLRIDRFLVDVRAKLKELGTLDKVKSIRVMGDGTWTPIGGNEEDDDDGGDSDDEKVGLASGSNPISGTTVTSTTNNSTTTNNTVNSSTATSSTATTSAAKRKPNTQQQKGQPPRKVARTDAESNAAAPAKRAVPTSRPIEIIEIDD